MLSIATIFTDYNGTPETSFGVEQDAYIPEDRFNGKTNEGSSTSFHKQYPDYVNEEGLCPWRPKSGLVKREKTRKQNNILCCS